MSRRVPLLSTAIVLLAVGAMIALGVWQLGRGKEKAAMIARYQAAAANPEVADWPGDEASAEHLLYRRARLDCVEVIERSAIAGQNADGVSGLGQVATCRTGEGQEARVILGWSREPEAPDWRGGQVAGTIAPGPRLVADPPLAGLQANGIPDPSSIPDNHLSYAVQWFFFAVTALAIYVLALRKRWRQ